ncbi:conserved protein, unknown function, partial [Hepatocystis sp. ex Piliocolobus tephrosceles]
IDNCTSNIDNCTSNIDNCTSNIDNCTSNIDNSTIKYDNIPISLDNDNNSDKNVYLDIHTNVNRVKNFFFLIKQLKHKIIHLKVTDAEQLYNLKLLFNYLKQLICQFKKKNNYLFSFVKKKNLISVINNIKEIINEEKKSLSIKKQNKNYLISLLYLKNIEKKLDKFVTLFLKMGNNIYNVVCDSSSTNNLTTLDSVQNVENDSNNNYLLKTKNSFMIKQNMKKYSTSFTINNNNKYCTNKKESNYVTGINNPINKLYYINNKHNIDETKQLDDLNSQLNSIITIYKDGNLIENMPDIHLNIIKKYNLELSLLNEIKNNKKYNNDNTDCLNNTDIQSFAILLDYKIKKSEQNIKCLNHNINYDTGNSNNKIKKDQIKSSNKQIINDYFALQQNKNINFQTNHPYNKTISNDYNSYLAESDVNNIYYHNFIKKNSL